MLNWSWLTALIPSLKELYSGTWSCKYNTVLLYFISIVLCPIALLEIVISSKRLPYKLKECGANGGYLQMS